MARNKLNERESKNLLRRFLYQIFNKVFGLAQLHTLPEEKKQRIKRWGKQSQRKKINNLTCREHVLAGRYFWKGSF